MSDKLVVDLYSSYIPTVFLLMFAKASLKPTAISVQSDSPLTKLDVKYYFF